MKYSNRMIATAFALFAGLWLISSNASAAPMLDLAILVDISGGGQNKLDNWSDMQAYLTDLVQNHLPESNTRIGLIEFGDNANTLYGFNDSQDRDDIAAVTSTIVHFGGHTNTIGAVQAAIDLFDTQSTQENDKAVLLFTDGTPNRPAGNVDPCRLSPDLFMRSIDVLVAGIGERYAAYGQDKHDCLVQSYDDMTTIDRYGADELAQSTSWVTSRLYQQGGQTINEPATLPVLLTGLIGMVVGIRLRRSKA